MNFNTGQFRDKYLVKMAICFDWELGCHHAELTFKAKDNTTVTYRIAKLKAWHVYEDFAAKWVEQCLIAQSSSRIYLSLDPYNEAEPSKDKDNYWFEGETMELLSD